MSQEQMSQEDFAIVKLAAAQRYKERNIHPETANYLFERKLSKLAQVPGPQVGPTRARAFFEANRGRSPLQTAVNADGEKPAGGAMPAVRRAVSGVTRGIGNAIGPSKPVRDLIARGVGGAMAKAAPSAFEKQQSAKEAAAPDKITKLAGALKDVLPPKQADAKADKTRKLSEGLKKLVNG